MIAQLAHHAGNRHGNLNRHLTAVEHERLNAITEDVAQGLAKAFKLGTHVWDTRQRAIVEVRLILF
jgi:hypothetical protein